MSYIIWKTPKGSIDTIADNEFFSFQLEAVDSDSHPLTFHIIAGQLSNGLQLFQTSATAGLIKGIPIVEKTTENQFVYTQTFTVRAARVDNPTVLSDRTFSITINSISLPQIIPSGTPLDLGVFFDGGLMNKQLIAIDPSPTAPLTWTLIDGALPAGVTLTPSGKLTGYIEPFVTLGAAARLYWSKTGWDTIPWDTLVALAESKTYMFKVQVFDGLKYDECSYTMFVQAKSKFTVDNILAIPHVDTTYITADMDNHHSPFIITDPSTLPEQRQLSNFAFKITGRDLDMSTLRYALVSLPDDLFDQGPDSVDPTTGFYPEIDFDMAGFDQRNQALPDGVSLDPLTGWITGELGEQPEERKVYKFQVFCYKEENPASRSLPVEFTLVVLGDVTNTITWITPEFLGSIDNGSISELFIQAISSKGKTLNYRFKESFRQPGKEDMLPGDQVIKYYDPTRNELPQGLKLFPDGLIVGRTTFEHFQLDGGNTTLDKKITNFDNEFQFTVTASDEESNVVVAEIPVNTTNVKIMDFKFTDFSADTIALSLVGADAGSFKIRNGNELYYVGQNIGQTVIENSIEVLTQSSYTLKIIPYNAKHEAGRTLIYRLMVLAAPGDQIVRIGVNRPPSISADKTFRVRVNNYNEIPYENIYLRALPSRQQRLDFQNLISNKDIFPDELMYRINDPWFSKSKDIKFLFAAGLTPTNASAYIASMANHHYNKIVNLGNVKTAVALDANFNVKYDIVYVDVIDLEAENNKSVASVINRSTQVSSQYNVMPFSVVYPHSFDNMKNDLITVGYSNRGALPEWMTTQQENGQVLGFTRGVILAYTKPGAGKLVAFRLQQSNVQFNGIDFVADRYQLDHYLSKNFVISDQKFVESFETMFDNALPGSLYADSTVETRFDGGATRFYNNRDKYAVPETDDVYLKFPRFNIYG